MPTAEPLQGRVLVLGGTGLIGGEVAYRLARDGAKVRVLARGPVPPELRAGFDGVELMRGDAADQRLVRQALKGCAHVVHAVGALYPGESDHDPGADARITLPPLVELLELLREQPETDLVFLSSGGTVYGEPAVNPVPETANCEPITSYGVMKLAAEKYIAMYSRLYGIHARVARVANAYGPRQRAGRGQGAVAAFLAASLSGDPAVIYGDGTITRDYVHAEDIASAVVSLIGLSGAPGIVNVGTGTGHTLTDVLDVVQAATGVALTILRKPARPFDVQRIVLDCGRLQELVAWHPRDLATGMRETWEEMLSWRAGASR